MIERREFEPLIPHSGAMCLIDRVLQWGQKDITCATQTHKCLDNPLRKDSALPSIHLIEYAAQTMAIHGALLARQKDEVLGAAYLAGVKNVRLNIDRLDDLDGDIDIATQQLICRGGSMLYQFDATSSGAQIGSGRITVIEQG